MTTATVEAPTAPAAPVAAVPAPAPAVAGPDYSSVKAPKGVEMKPEYVAQHVEWARKANISPEHAQAALERRHADHLENVSVFEAEAKGWPDVLKADAVFGGKNYDQNIKNRDAVLDRAVAANPALKAAVDEFKAGPWANQPLFAQVLAAVGGLFAEKPAVVGTPAGAAPSAGKTAFPHHSGRYLHWTKDEAREYDLAHGIPPKT